MRPKQSYSYYMGKIFLSIQKQSIKLSNFEELQENRSHGKTIHNWFSHVRQKAQQSERKKKQTSDLKERTPFQRLKTQQIQNKKQGKLRHRKKMSNLQKIMIVKGYENTKKQIQGRQSNFKSIQQSSPMKTVYISEGKGQVQKNKQQTIKYMILKQKQRCKTENIGVFQKSASKLLLSNGTKKYSLHSKNINNLFFSPSQVNISLYSQPMKGKKLKQRPRTCKPYHRYEKTKKNGGKFNFDGTLQNKSISIPKRPTTQFRNINYYEMTNSLNYPKKNYKKMNSKLELKKMISHKKQENLDLQPWQNNKVEAFIDDSYSSIHQKN